MNRSLRVYFAAIFIQAFVALGVIRPAFSTELFAEVGETTTFNSNIYFDDSKEWDLVLSPNASLDLELGRLYGLGYSGQVSIFPRHSDLLFHVHSLYFLINPTWGEDNENELVVDLSATTHRNTDTFADVNLIEPMLFLSLNLSPYHWLSWSLSETVSYRWFYDNTISDALTTWSRGDVTFTAPTRTTIAPRIVFGLRHYPRETLSDRTDHQLRAGLRLSQNLSEGVGLRLDYAYIHAFDDSVLTRRNVDALTFHYIGEDFLFTGHQTHAGWKMVLDNGFSADASLQFEYRRYGGWPVRDELGVATTKTRTDRALAPSVLLAYQISPSESASPAVPGLKITLQYTFVRNWSNDDWYDTNRHLASLGLTLDW